MAEGDLGEGGWSLEPICNVRDAAAPMGAAGGDAIGQLCQARHLLVLLMEASAMMGLHCNAILDSIIPMTLKYVPSRPANNGHYPVAYGGQAQGAAANYATGMRPFLL